MKGRSWYRIMLMGAVSIFCLPLLAQVAAQEGEALDERLAIEVELIEIKERLSGIEEPVVIEEPERSRDSKSPIFITLVSKNFIEADPIAGDLSDRIDFIFDITNNLTKDVEAFNGVLVLKDLYDQKLLESELIIEDTIKAGVLLGWRGSISLDYDSSLDTHRRLLIIDENQLKVELILKEVIYPDGTREFF